LVVAPDTTVAAADRFLTLQEAAAELRVCAKTLSEFLKAHPAELPLYARVGRQYLISTIDLYRIYEAMKSCHSSSPDEGARPTSISAALSEAKVYSKLRALTTK
jgi:hypothetical protein